METNCVSCKKNTANENSSARKTKQNILILLSNCAVCGKKKSTFIKKKELHNFNDWFKMNKVIKKRLLTGDKVMPELHLKQPRFTYNACGPITTHRERIQTFREIGNLKHLYRNESDKACSKRTISDKVLKDRAHEIARNRSYDGYQRALASMVYMFFDKKTGLRASVNEQLAEELHKPVIKKIKIRKFYARFKYNIWSAVLAEKE